MTQVFTTPDFWKEYWSDKKSGIKNIGVCYYFWDVLKSAANQIKNKSFVEVGGFPGYYAVYAKKYLNLDSTILDYYIDSRVVKNLLRKNGLPEDAISIVKADVFKYKTIKKYGLVFSSGFLEHFEDPVPVVKKHLELLDKNSWLVITIPNMKGFNGLLQRIFDPGNLQIHNLSIMDIDYLTKMVKGCGLKNVGVEYYGGFGVWLENLHKRNILLRLSILVLSGIGLIIRKLGVNGKLISPHIVIAGMKK